MESFLIALAIFFPAAISNSSPIVASKLKIFRFLDIPIDLRLTVRGKRIFGDHKTFRGYLVGIVAGASTSYLLFDVAGFPQLIDSGYSGSAFLFGAVLGFGALLGDSIESFFKRQVGVQPGSSWVPFDQIDFLIGGCIVVLLFTDVGLLVYLWIVLIYGLMHPLATIIGYYLGLKQDKI
ncbi:CDP-archaeol synthase [Candidatus Nomurabacteria bacterium]|uniref:CDP-archaeol synthase n=1 Tax=Candidatus Dojkabacteria bacterium TaxID=2099670 RepID=A0A955KY51_9BACT|nr:CDP-archaeol synthase [Candidatus Dojkabacteria bacterium]MCB9789913.1 CDP-archaeol synthase [Candidatus Nomurabacteria bacterium]MCB9803464.1 CDP-archaeol synthase [Candidatus Nomurabacteria bacterium]